MDVEEEGVHENRGYDLDEDDEDGEAGGDAFHMRRMVGREDPIVRDEEEEEETSFGGLPETEPLIGEDDLPSRWDGVEHVNLSERTEEAKEIVRRKYPRCDFSKFNIMLSDEGKVMVSLTGRGKPQLLFTDKGDLTSAVRRTKGLMAALGSHADDIIRENERSIGENLDELSQIESRTDGEQTEADQRRSEELMEENDSLEAENEEIENRMFLREKVVKIFSDHGLTAFAVLSAVGTIIGVIVSNLKSGLSKMTKGIGNGLKDIAKKLAGILPGIVGSLVSFLFKTAGEAIGFLSKHAWLLILLVVTFVVEQFKGRGRRD